MSKADIFNIYKYLKEKDINSYNSKVPAHFKNALGNSTNEAKTPIYNPKRTRKPVYLNINSNNGGIKFPNFPELGTSVKLTIDDVLFTNSLFDLNTPPTVTNISNMVLHDIAYWGADWYVMNYSLPYATLYKTNSNFSTFTQVAKCYAFGDVVYLTDDYKIVARSNTGWCEDLTIFTYNTTTQTTTQTTERILLPNNFFLTKSCRGSIKSSRNYSTHYNYPYDYRTTCHFYFNGVVWYDFYFDQNGRAEPFTKYKNDNKVVFLYHNLLLKGDDIRLYYYNDKYIGVPGVYHRVALTHIGVYLFTSDGIFKITPRINPKYLSVKPKIVITVPSDGSPFYQTKSITGLIPGIKMPSGFISVLKNNTIFTDPLTQIDKNYMI